MAAATYRVGPSDFFTPGDLSSDADTVNGQIAQLDAQIQGNELATGEFTDQWTHFEVDWRTFYQAHFGGFFSNLFSALNDSNRDDLIRYENQLAAFQASAAAFGASLIAPVGPSSGSKDTIGDQLSAQGLPSKSTLIVLGIIAVVVLVLWKSPDVVLRKIK